MLLWLADRERNALEGYTSAALDLHARLLTPYRKIPVEELERLLSGGALQVDMLERRQFIYLEAVREGALTIPILSLQCDFGLERVFIRLRVALFVLDRDAPSELRAVGYRFESPEQPGEDGTESIHNYYHVQLFTHYKKNDPAWELPNCPAWMPTKQPAFTIDAYSPLSLLNGMVISIYGGGFFRQTMARHRLWRDLRPYEDMHCVKAWTERQR
jgi:hypothetical protein